jgi:hypothetical protein
VKAQVGGIYLNSAPSTTKAPKESGVTGIKVAVELKPGINGSSLKFIRINPSVSTPYTMGTGFLAGVEFAISNNFYLVPHIGFLNIYPRLNFNVNDTIVQMGFDMQYLHLPVLLRYNIYESAKLSIYGGAGLDLGINTRAKFFYEENPSLFTYNGVIITNRQLFEPSFTSFLLNLGLKAELSHKMYVTAEGMLNGGRNVLSTQVLGQLFGNAAFNQEFFSLQYYLHVGIGIWW